MVSALTRRTGPVPPAPASRPSELISSVHDVVKGLFRRMHPALEQEGITMGQFWSLHLVSSLGSASLGAVARYLAVSAPTVCTNVDQLEAGGYVVRRRSTTDRRTVEVRLTPKGQRVESRLWAKLGELMEETATGLPDDDLAAAVRVFRTLRRRLELDARGGVGA